MKRSVPEQMQTWEPALGKRQALSCFQSSIVENKCSLSFYVIFILICVTLLKTNVATLGQIQEYKHVSYTGPKVYVSMVFVMQSP